MKVLHINSYYLLRPLHQTMIEHLNRTGVESVVMAHTSGAEAPVITPAENVHVMKCFNKWDKPFFYLKQAKVFRAAKKEFNFSDFDFTHSYSLFSSGNCSYQIKKKYGVPYLVAVRDTDVNVFLKKKPYLKGRGYRILKNASKIFFLSPMYKESVISKVVPKENRAEIAAKSEVIPNGIDDFWLENLYSGKTIRENLDPVKILFVGEISKRKNLPRLIEAIKFLQKKGMKIDLTVIGKKIDRDIYEAMMKEDFITYHEPMGKESLIKYYRENDLFVLPSLTETFGLVYAEAMSQALPVLYTKGQGFDGQFEDGIVGYAIDAEDPSDIARRIKDSLARLGELGKNCVELAPRFGWTEITKHYAEIYKELKLV